MLLLHQQQRTPCPTSRLVNILIHFNDDNYLLLPLKAIVGYRKNNINFCAFFFQLEKKVVTVGEGEHPLQCPYSFWFSRRPQGKPQASTNYADNIKLVGKFASVSFFFVQICGLPYSDILEYNGIFFFFLFLFLTTQVEQFWGFYSYLVRPGDLTGHSDIHLFKDGIKPMWEVGYFLYSFKSMEHLPEETEHYKYCIIYHQKVLCFQSYMAVQQLLYN